MSTHQFQTEVSRLLHLIIHSLYSHKEIFLRELISNASDALDKLKYLTLTSQAHASIAFEPKISISFSEKEPKTLTIEDSGIGMNEADLTEHLGTIARSGTKQFLDTLSGDQRKDSNLIGQFGVGFYSSFMVASKVEVTSKKAGEDKAWKWSSDGQGSYEIAPAEKASHGTCIVLYLNDEGAEFASNWRIEDVIKKYSNHIAFPIYLSYEKVKYDDKGKESTREPVTEQVNTASALWKRSKSELKPEDYKEFYKTAFHDMDEPLFWMHTQAEGTLEYTTLFYVPTKAPFDLFHAEYRPGVKLFVKRVFITDDNKELMPTYLRFLRGVIDSEDLPLNVSREILQQNRIMTNIRSASVKKVLGEFQRVALEDPETYKTFIAEFNRPLKEGLYTDFGNRDTLLELVRFKSTMVDGFTSLEEYTRRMTADQKTIYFISGGQEAMLRKSPLLEAYKKKNLEVLIMDDEIDEIVAPGIGKYKDFELKSVSRSDAGEELKNESDKEKEKEFKPVVEKIKAALGDRVKDVISSVRLTDSPSCIVTDESDPSFKMQAMFKAMGQKDMPEIKPILEVNPDHPITAMIKQSDDSALIADVSALLLEEALLAEGMEIKDLPAFIARMNRLVVR